jgi:hypothetical protein
VELSRELALKLERNDPQINKFKQLHDKQIKSCQKLFVGANKQELDALYKSAKACLSNSAKGLKNP